MRMMIRVQMPVEAGNRALVEEKLQKVVTEFTDQAKPEAMYFAADRGLRTIYSVFDMQNPSQMPAYLEPFFVHLNASVEIFPAMNSDDLKAGLGKISRRMP